MYDGLEAQLQKKGFEVYTVNKLQKVEGKLGHDFNVINYAKDNGMTLVTNDGEMGKACKANGYPCVLVDIDKIGARIIIPELDNLRQTLGLDSC
jgi:predicted nuclease of predicted toxin-antitoxin system